MVGCRAIRYSEGTGRAVSCGFEVTDCFGRAVTLEHSNWQKHLADGRHSEVVPYHGLIVNVLQHPDVVVEADRDGQYHYFRRGVGTGAFAGYWLQIVVGGDKVRTWRLVPALGVPGRQVWPRQRWA